jgi:protein SCO1
LSVVKKISVVSTLVVLTVALSLAQGKGPPVQGALEPDKDAPAVSERNPQLETLKGITIEQRLNQQVPLDLEFKDEAGRTVKLGQYFGKKPVVLALVYYECPMLCTQVLNGLTSALTVLKFNVGEEFEVVTVSFDSRETPGLASAKKEMYLKRYKREGAAEGWHFLTGKEPSIQALTKAVGFGYKWDEETKQFAHGSAIMVLTPQGRLAQYYYGIEYSPKDLRLAMVEASQGKIGNLVDKVILYCYNYDPTTGRYGMVAMRVIRLAAVATVLMLGGFIALMLWREKHQQLRIRTGQA